MVTKFPIVQLDSKVSQSCITVQQDMSREYHSPKYQKYQYLKNVKDEWGRSTFSIAMSNIFTGISI